MSAEINASTDKKHLRYFHDLVAGKSYSQEYTSDMIQKLSEENPHIPPWVFSSSLGFMRGELSTQVHYAFDKGVLAWVKNPNHRIKYLGSSLTTISEDPDDQNNSEPDVSPLHNELVAKNPHQPPWTFWHMTIEQFEDRLIAAFNEGEIIWVKNPEERKDLLAPETSSDSDKMSWGTKLFFVLWLAGLYYTVNVSFENAYGWEYIIKCVWVLLTLAIVFAMLKLENRR